MKSMKFFAGIGAILVVIVGGFIIFASRAKAPNSVSMMEEKSASYDETTKEDRDDSQARVPGVSQWLSWLQGGKKLSCAYRMPGAQNDQMISMQLDGKKYRSEFQIGKAMMVSVFDGETLYNWDTDKKTGSQMKLSCLQEVHKTLPQGQENTYYDSSEDAVTKAPDITCHEAESVDMMIPTDVKFVDQCAMMQSSAKMMEQYKQQMPEGSQDMMKRMGY